MTQQGEAEARGRAEPRKEGQRQHPGFRVRADREGEDAGAKASKMGLWGPGSSALLPGRDGQPWKGVNEKAPALQPQEECHSTANRQRVEACQGAFGSPARQSVPKSEGKEMSRRPVRNLSTGEGTQGRVWSLLACCLKCSISLRIEPQAVGCLARALTLSSSPSCLFSQPTRDTPPPHLRA